MGMTCWIDARPELLAIINTGNNEYSEITVGFVDSVDASWSCGGDVQWPSHTNTQVASSDCGAEDYRGRGDDHQLSGKIAVASNSVSR